jgi:5'(3')-deoxyribonucleotidase
MRIIIDQDAIVCQWTERIIEWWNEDMGTSVTMDDITDWNTHNCLGPQGKYFIRSCIRYPEFYRDLDAVPGAIEGTRRLMEAGHDVIMASACPKMAAISYVGKIEWLRREMPFFPLENFVSIQRKSLLQGDLLFDDGSHNIREWNDTARFSVVMDYPWNQDLGKLRYPMMVGRVKDWSEFLNVVEQISEETEHDT